MREPFKRLFTLIIRLSHGALPYILVAGLPYPAICSAEPTIENTDALSTRRLETMTIEGEAIDESSFEMDRSVSTINRETIEQRQSGNVMELLQDIPGVSIQGGPRPGGMRIGIRGFDSNEDVITRIDGATQNFEKYRYGLGLSIDPELLKQVEVSRGSAVLTRGSGALGGVVEMETVDARDLLGADQTWGLRAKYGHRFNNDSKQVTLTGMANPFDFMDVLVSGIKRQTNDYTLPDGSRYPDSEETQLSGLGKVEFYTDQSEFSFGYRFSDESGMEPFDATGGGPGVGGTVFRTSKENSYTLNMRLQPDSDWLNIKGSVGFTDKTLTDEGSAIASGTDIFQYDNWSAELRNQSNFEILGINALLTVGGQFNQEARDITRINNLGTNNNPAQPPGAKTSYGVFLEQQVFIDDFILGAGLRGDFYRIDAAGDTADILNAQHRPTSIDIVNLSPAFSFTWQSSDLPISVFYSYAELFRPPLIDEYFTVPPMSRCATFSAFKPLPSLPVRNDFPADSAGTLAWLDALNQHPAVLAAAEQDPFSKKNAVCADYYQPEQSQNHEIGLSYNMDSLFSDSDFLSAKLTFFYTHVDHILESIYQDSVTGEISQPGIEVRHGFEFDLRYDSEHYFASLVLSTLDGYRQLNYFDNNSNPAVSNVPISAIQDKEDLVDSPADKLIFTLGRKFPEYRFELGYRLEAYADRLVTTGVRDIPGCSSGSFVVPSCNEIGTQKGYVLHDLFATWKPWQDTAIRLNVDNLTNTSYNLPGFGGGEGVTAPGIDIRLSISQQF